MAWFLEKQYGPLMDGHPFPKPDVFCAIPYGATYEERRRHLLDKITELAPGITHF